MILAKLKQAYKEPRIEKITGQMKHLLKPFDQIRSIKEFIREISKCFDGKTTNQQKSTKKNIDQIRNHKIKNNSHLWGNDQTMNRGEVSTKTRFGFKKHFKLE